MLGRILQEQRLYLKNSLSVDFALQSIYVFHRDFVPARAKGIIFHIIVKSLVSYLYTAAEANLPRISSL